MAQTAENTSHHRVNCCAQQRDPQTQPEKGSLGLCGNYQVCHKMPLNLMRSLVASIMLQRPPQAEVLQCRPLSTLHTGVWVWGEPYG